MKGKWNQPYRGLAEEEDDELQRALKESEAAFNADKLKRLQQEVEEKMLQ